MAVNFRAASPSNKDRELTTQLKASWLSSEMVIAANGVERN